MPLYHEFFITPEGEVDIRKFHPDKSFDQWRLGNAWELPKEVLKGLEAVDRRLVELWNQASKIIGDDPTIQVYVFRIGKDKTPSVELTIGIPTELRLERIRLPIRYVKSPPAEKRWGGKFPIRYEKDPPKSADQVYSSLQTSFEDAGFSVGGGFQGDHYPITASVSRWDAVQRFVDTLDHALDVHGMTRSDLYRVAEKRWAASPKPEFSAWEQVEPFKDRCTVCDTHHSRIVMVQPETRQRMCDVCWKFFSSVE